MNDQLQSRQRPDRIDGVTPEPPHAARVDRESTVSLPLSTSWAQRLGDSVSRRLWFLEGERLCEAARRRTRLQDFGDPPVQPALSVLARSLETEADLHPLGRFLMRFHLRGLLETRLRLANLWRSQAQPLSSVAIHRPVFITGMPRSGSTFLHELMAEDPDNRSPRVWEVMFPVPPRPTPRSAREPRIRKAQACLWWFRRLAPQADAVFPMRAMTPHECVAIHSYSFLSEEFVSTCRVPAYEAFLRSTSLRPAYEWQHRFLQHLQLGHPPRRWVLKSPDHAYGLEQLFAVFPDALIIQTHRNPSEVLRSSCHLTEVLYGLYARKGKGEPVGTREVRMLSGLVERFIQFRDAHPEYEDRFLDIQYTELVSDPLAAVRRIYNQFDLPLTSAAAERMAALAARRARYRGPRASLAGAALSSEVLAGTASFQRYCSRFGIAPP